MRLHSFGRTIVALAIAAIVAATGLPASAEDTTDNLLDAITKGSFKLNLRYRYEDVDQDGFEKRGQASTLRTMAGYRTGTWKGLEVYLEFEDIRDLGFSNDHNNAGAGSLWNGVPSASGCRRSSSTTHVLSAMWVGARTTRASRLLVSRLTESRT